MVSDEQWIDDDASGDEDEDETRLDQNDREPRSYTSRTGESIETRLDVSRIEKNSQQVKTKE